MSSAQDTAASAALKASGSVKKKSPLDADNKLSSASAAQSLKRAQPRDLPSFPITGVANKEASAGAAASLAFAGHKQFEHWKPEHSHSAGRAALLAQDAKGPELWQHELSAAGSKAALLAHKNNTGVQIWQPDSTPEGNSAAGIAMKAKAKDEPTTPKSTTPALGDTRRRRAGSQPVSYAYPDSANSASNALKAATKAHAPKVEAVGYNDLPGFSPEEAARIHKAATTNMDRAMYTSAPPVAPEVEEKNRQAGLRAAAISMAKNMMAAQERAAETRQRDDGETAARASHANTKTSAEVDRREAALQYLTLQDAAKKLAAERLAKINDESEEYRKYYGAFSPKQARLSIRGRRRSSSDGGLDSSDRARSEKIRSEMSIFNSKLAEVDSKKRQSDRDAVLAAAQKNVRNSMAGLDQKVFQDTGKASPALKAQWEAAARDKAEKDSKARMENYGKVHIGGGQYMFQSEIDAIAAAKVQPTLDEVSRKAEAQRALDEQRRQEAEEQKRVAEAKAAEERERKRETKQIWQKFKTEEKEKKKEEKEEEEVQRIYQATAEEQDRKALAAEQEVKKAAAERDEREKQAKTETLWKELKDSEKKEKEEAKARKNQENRRSRIGSMFASIGFGERKKDEDSKGSKGKAPEVAKPKSPVVETPKAEPVKSEEIQAEEIKTEAVEEAKPDVTEETEESVEHKHEPDAEDTAEIAKTSDTTAKTAFPAFAPASVPLDVIANATKTEESEPVSQSSPTTSNQKSALSEIASTQAEKKVFKPEVIKPIAVTPVSAAPKPVYTATASSSSALKSTTDKKDEPKQSWFKRKFSRSSKEGRPQPGMIGGLKRNQNEASKSSESRAKELKISAPVPIGSTAIATTSPVRATHSLPSTAGTASTSRGATQDEVASTDVDAVTAIAAASALPSHLSTVHRTDTDTNLSERDVALAGKEEHTTKDESTATEDDDIAEEEPQALVSPVSAVENPLILSSIPEPPSALSAPPRSRSTTISSLTSHDSGTPSNSMRGVASVALATGERLDAEEALRLAEENQSLNQVETTRTSESQDMFEEARDNLNELSPSVTERTEIRKSSSGSLGGPRETKFHEEL